MGEDELRQLLEFVPDAMLLARQDGTLVFANRQAGKLLGYTLQELTGLRVGDLVPERLRDVHAHLCAAYCTAPAARPMGNHRELFALREGG